ncbi:hypothetical protein [Mesorhizobium sp. LNHC209A00]|uniref:hypothetical protein n=1 Tax=Mesorhizobium australicum TaxID=536018 RepID=UPI0012EBD0D8
MIDATSVEAIDSARVLLDQFKGKSETIAQPHPQRGCYQDRAKCDPGGAPLAQRDEPAGLLDEEVNTTLRPNQPYRVPVKRLDAGDGKAERHRSIHDLQQILTTERRDGRHVEAGAGSEDLWQGCARAGPARAQPPVEPG